MTLYSEFYRSFKSSEGDLKGFDPDGHIYTQTNSHGHIRWHTHSSVQIKRNQHDNVMYIVFGMRALELHAVVSHSKWGESHQVHLISLYIHWKLLQLRPWVYHLYSCCPTDTPLLCPLFPLYHLSHPPLSSTRAKPKLIPPTTIQTHTYKVLTLNFYTQFNKGVLDDRH